MYRYDRCRCRDQGVSTGEPADRNVGSRRARAELTAEVAGSNIGIKIRKADDLEKPLSALVLVFPDLINCWHEWRHRDLPSKYQGRVFNLPANFVGGSRIRTGDIVVRPLALSRLSYPARRRAIEASSPSESIPGGCVARARLHKLFCLWHQYLLPNQICFHFSDSKIDCGY